MIDAFVNHGHRLVGGRSQQACSPLRSAQQIVIPLEDLRALDPRTLKDTAGDVADTVMVGTLNGRDEPVTEWVDHHDALLAQIDLSSSELIEESVG